jgi:hypothetical protein
MCFESENELVPFDETIDKTNCCKCYYRNYYEQFTLFPGSKCSLTQCEQCCEDTYEDGHPHSDCCCNTNPSVEPPCANLSCLFCPIALVFDIVSMPFRCIDRKCYDCKQTKEMTSKDKTNEIVSDTIPVEPNTEIVMDQPK